MNLYLTTLFFAIPSFGVLIILEIIISKAKGMKVANTVDTISSLSSGLTNTIKDVLKVGVVVVSYGWLVDKVTIFVLEPLWLSIIVAFIVQDFMGYWMHRLNHRVNVFWNRHIIHHSSEEFNLSCALRQSISEIFRFSAILMIPAAIFGIPASIFAILAPIHLFMQFWYHTRLIDKLGFLEYIIVTPSHHRVHHAINKEYLDKNYGQIFIIWDKLFGTFQPELKNVKPVYGTLRPVSTWNPIVINFKHIFQIAKDAWHAKSYIDKIKIWFMPTGWRPDDVKINYPLIEVNNVGVQVKYNTDNSKLSVCWSFVQFVIANLMTLHLFILISKTPSNFNMIYLYTVFIFLHVFLYTSQLDKKNYSFFIQLINIFYGLYIIYFQNFNWFGLPELIAFFIIGYFALSLFISHYLLQEVR